MKIFVLLSSLTISLIASEIIIKSSKTNTKEEDAVQTINIFNKEQIEQLNIKDINDLSMVLSNVNISGIGNRTDRTFSFRGISNYVTYESSVSMYIDDTPVPFSYGYGAFDVNSISSIEVLKGPQGTLFGKSAQSGVINLYTNSFTDKTINEFKFGLGTYNKKEFYGRNAGKINEKIKYSLSISKDKRDGFSTNKSTNKNFDYKDLLSSNIKFKYDIDDNSDVFLNYNYIKTDDGGSAFKMNTKEDRFNIYNETKEEFVKMQNHLFSLKYRYDVGDFDFTSVSSYTKEKIDKYDYINILGGLSVDFDIDIEEFTQEFRTNYKFDNTKVLFGAFYSDKLNFNYVENQTLETLNLNSLNNLDNIDTNKALFSQVEFYNGGNFIYTTGLRYQETQRHFTRDLTEFNTTNTKTDDTTSWNHILPMASISYFASDNSKTYLTYSKGYRPGGYNYRANSTYKPEETKSIELAYKKKHSNSLITNYTLFYNSIKNHRINTFDDNLSSTVLNAPKAHSLGLEIDLKYEKDKLTTFGSFGYLKGRFEKFEQNNVSYKSNNILDVPNITSSFGLKYKLDKTQYIQGNIKYMGKRYYNISNTAKENGYSISNISYGFKKDNWDGLVYIDNLFDKKYVDFMIYTPSNDYYHFGNPRMIGIKLSKSF